MFDVIITTVPSRKYLYNTTVSAIRQQKGYNKIHTIEKKMMERYIYANEIATTPLYILCDDDIIPANDTTFLDLVNTLATHREFSQIGLSWKPDMQSEMNNPWLLPGDTPLWGADHVGGCVAIRKESLDFPVEYDHVYGDDKVVAAIARGNGYKVGILSNRFFYHIGEGQSTYHLST